MKVKVWRVKDFPQNDGTAHSSEDLAKRQAATQGIKME